MTAYSRGQALIGQEGYARGTFILCVPFFVYLPEYNTCRAKWNGLQQFAKGSSPDTAMQSMFSRVLLTPTLGHL